MIIWGIVVVLWLLVGGGVSALGYNTAPRIGRLLVIPLWPFALIGSLVYYAWEGYEL